MESVLGSATFQIISTVVTVLLSWRLWRFKIRPRLYPQEPKEYPYYIPFIGHVAAFFSDFNGAIEKGRKHFEPSRKPFTITVAGQTLYVATSAEDINAVWKNTETISIDPIAMNMFTMSDISKKSAKALFESHPGARYNASNVRPLTPTDNSNELHRQQLSGPRLEALVMDKVVPGIISRIDMLDANHAAVFSRSGKSVTVSLLRLCVDLFMTQFTDAFFGPKLRQIAPGLIVAMESWELSNWKFLFQVPGIFARDLNAAKASLTDGFARYFSLPRAERPGSTFYVDAIEDMLREVGLGEEELGKFTILQYWAIVGNVYKLAFWLVAHLTSDPLLIDEIRQEVLPAVKGSIIDEAYLLKECPKLDSLFNETARLSVSSSLARVVTETSVVGGKTLKPGNKIMLPIKELHYNPTAWASDPNVFQPERFSANPKPSKSLSYRPWGGGHTLCPGRFLARRSINVFVALLLARYDLEVVSTTFPKADNARPSPSVVLVAEGQDVKLKCTPR